MIPQDFLKALATQQGVSDTEQEVLLLAMSGQSTPAIAKQLEIQEEAVRKRLGEVYKKFRIVGAGPGKLAKLQQLLVRQYQDQQSGSDSFFEHVPERVDFSKKVAQSCQDWGEAPEIPVFYGRTEDLKNLQQWIVDQRCRLVGILGMGGMGKTSLSVKLAKETQNKFQYVIWRSLREAPPVDKILADWIKFLSGKQQLHFPEALSDKITQLIYYLQSSHCLLVLDNAEAILKSDRRVGQYQEGYEGYGELFRQIGEQQHQSCLVLTSREKPKEITLLEGRKNPVRSFLLTGLEVLEAQKIFEEHGEFSGSEEDWERVIHHYAGNPLALKIVASIIQDLLDGDISQFIENYLNSGKVVFDDILNILDDQFNRLSASEKEVLYWLAINREAVSDLELKNDIVSSEPQQKLLMDLTSLRRRSLIEKTETGFTLQNVVMEYLTDRLIVKVCREIRTGELELMNSHTLIKATAKDYLRESQIRLILKPIKDNLVSSLGGQKKLEKQLVKILSRLQEELPLNPGYAGGNILNLLCQIQTNLTGYNFSCLAIWQAYLKNINLYDINFTQADLSRSVFPETFSSIMTIAFSPDGQLLAAGDTHGEIHEWQVSDDKPPLTWKGHEGWVRSVTFSPHGQNDLTLASVSHDKTVKLWNPFTGEHLRTLEGHTDWVLSLAYANNTNTTESSPVVSPILASSSGDHEIRLWDTSTGNCLQTLRGHSDRVWCIDFSPNAQILASASDDKTLKLWNIETGECFQTLSGHTDGIWCVVFSPDGQTLASSSDDKTIKLWDVATGQCLKTLREHRSWVVSIVFSPDGQVLASGSDDKTVKLWNPNTGECLKTLLEHTSRVQSVAFSPNGQVLASSSDDRTVRMWDVRTGKSLKTLQSRTNWVHSVSFSPDGQTLASGSDDHTVRIWDIKTEKPSQTFIGHSGRVWCVAFSPNGQILASSSDDKTIKLWDIATGKCLKTLVGHTYWVWCVAFSPNGQILASSSDDKTVKLWNVATGQCLHTLKEHQSWVSSVAFSPDSQILASGSNDKTVKLWNTETGECLKTLNKHTERVLSVAFSPDGQILASGSEDKSVQIWNPNTGQCLNTFQEHTDCIRSVAFSPDGQRVASGSEDKSVRVWNVKTGQCLKTLSAHTDRIWSVSFSPTDQLLASGSEDETIRLWDTQTGECLKILRVRKSYSGTNITGVTGLTEAQKNTLKMLGAFVSW